MAKKSKLRNQIKSLVKEASIASVRTKKIADPKPIVNSTNIVGSNGTPESAALLHYLRTGMVLMREGVQKVSYGTVCPFCKDQHVGKCKKQIEAEKSGDTGFSKKKIKEDASVGAADAQGAPTAGSDYQTRLNPVGRVSPKEMRKKAKSVRESYERRMVQQENRVIARRASTTVGGSFNRVLTGTKGTIHTSGQGLGGKIHFIKWDGQKGVHAHRADDVKKLQEENIVTSLDDLKDIFESYKPSDKLKARTKYLVQPQLSKERQAALASRKPKKKGYTPSSGTLGLAKQRAAQMSHNKKKISEGFFKKKSSISPTKTKEEPKKWKESDQPPVSGDFEYHPGLKKYYTKEELETTRDKNGHQVLTDKGMKQLDDYKRDQERNAARREYHKHLEYVSKPVYGGKSTESSLEVKVGHEKAAAKAMRRLLRVHEEVVCEVRNPYKPPRKGSVAWHAVEQRKKNDNTIERSKEIDRIAKVPDNYPKRKDYIPESFLTETKKKKSSGKVKRKYLGSKKGRTATGKPAHAIEIDPKLHVSNIANRLTGAIK